VLLVHGRDVVEPVEVADRLQVGLVLDQLLGAAVEEADVRVDALDDLAVQLRTNRNTPWAAGCCGPKWILNWRSSVSGMAGASSEWVEVVTGVWSAATFRSGPDEIA
jgi:hypothetical protein